jgi:hypothetical protein
MKFKREVCLLSLALLLFVTSVFFYSYQTGGSGVSLNWASYPYQGYALAFVSFGLVLTVTASISYAKRGKNMFSESFDFSTEN